MTTSFYERWGRTICIAALVLLPPLLLASKAALDSNRNNVVDWLPSDFPETKKLIWFIERFGSDEILGISWVGCTLNDPRLDQLAQRLVEPIALPQDKEPVVRFHHVFSGRETLAQFTQPPLELSEEEATRRMQGWLVGSDGRTTCAVALIAPGGEADRRAAIESVYQVAADCGIPRDTLRLGGPTADSVSIDLASQQWVSEMAVATAILGMGVAYLFLRDIRLVTILFFHSTFSWAVSLSLVYFLGQHMDAVLLMMPALVFVVAISGGVHLTNYYREFLPVVGPQRAVMETIRHGWLPCVLASVTTALGLASLAVSQLVPVRRFGILAAIGVLISLISSLTVWAAAQQIWRPRGTDGDAHEPHQPVRWWIPIYRLSTWSPWATLLVFAIALVPCGYGVWSLRSSTQLQDLLPEDSLPLQHYAWLQEHIGPLVPVEIVLNFPLSEEEKNSPRGLLARAEIVEQLRQRVAGLPDVGAAIAATTFAPSLPESGGGRQLAQRRVFATQFARHREALKQVRFLQDEEGSELWRISARVPSVGIDFGQFLEMLQQEVAAFVAREDERVAARPSALICGGVPLVFMAQKQLLTDLGESFVTAFLTIGLCLAVQVRSLAGGLVAMLPNVFPTIFAFGILGLANIPIDIGTMMTASVAMGIAVDDTLHFLSWFQRGLARFPDRLTAVRFAFTHSAMPMLQTTCIVAAGLAVFVLSPFKPIARFGGTMAGTLLLAIVGDLLLLPALLASPLGRFFKPSDASETVESTEAPAISDSAAV